MHIIETTLPPLPPGVPFAYIHVGMVFCSRPGFFFLKLDEFHAAGLSNGTLAIEAFRVDDLVHVYAATLQVSLRY